MEADLAAQRKPPIRTAEVGNGQDSSPEVACLESAQQVPPDQPGGFRLRQGEEIPKGIKRITRKQIDKALVHLSSGSEDPDEAIYNARVCFKRIRATLRLVRCEIGDELFKRENVCSRDAARQLSAVRDTAAMVETGEKVAHSFPAGLSAQAGAELREPCLRAQERGGSSTEKA